MKTASGINRFIEEKGYGKWFELLCPLVKITDLCQPDDYDDDDDDDDDDDNDCASPSSVLTEKSGELTFESKSLPVKKPAL